MEGYSTYIQASGAVTTRVVTGPCGVLTITEVEELLDIATLPTGGYQSYSTTTNYADPLTCINTPQPCPSTLGLNSSVMCTFGGDYNPTPVDGTLFQLITLSTYIRYSNQASPTQQELITFSVISGAASTGSSGNSIPTSSQTAASNVPVSRGMSTGAKAGIGVGVAGGILLVLVVFIILFIKKRHKRKVKEPHPNGPFEKGLDNPQTKPELADSAPVNTIPYAEYHKPELATRAKTVTESTSTSSWAGADLQSTARQGILKRAF